MANTGMPKSCTNEAATSSWVLNGFEAQITASAPPSRNVVIKLAVSVVTFRQAETFRPFRGFSFKNRLRMSSSTGIEREAHSILFLPLPARPKSFTSAFKFVAVAMIDRLLVKLERPKMKGRQ